MTRAVGTAGINELTETAVMSVPSTRKDAPASSSQSASPLLQQLAERARRQRLRHQLERIHHARPRSADHEADPSGEGADADVCDQPPGGASIGSGGASIGLGGAAGWRTSALSRGARTHAGHRSALNKPPYGPHSFRAPPAR
jgi:hypothetical protein